MADKSKVKLAWICIAFSRYNLAPKALRYDMCFIKVRTILPATKHIKWSIVKHVL